MFMVTANKLGMIGIALLRFGNISWNLFIEYVNMKMIFKSGLITMIFKDTTLYPLTAFRSAMDFFKEWHYHIFI